MGFRDDFISIRNSIYSNQLLGLAITYGGAPIEGVIFRPLADDQQARGNRLVDVAEIGVLRTALTSWTYGDQVVVDGRNWKVVKERPGSDIERLVLELESEPRKVW